jgi:3-hydroxyacyl-[acyl-carrier-protein] dehydratase
LPNATAGAQLELTTNRTSRRCSLKNNIEPSQFGWHRQPSGLDFPPFELLLGAMPASPLIDFERLDLSRVVFGRDEIRSLLKQRGRFEMLDGILHLDVEGKLDVGFKDVRADEWWAEDHIPGRPIFPGALMIEAAAQVCSFDFLKRAQDWHGKFVGFGGLGETRFRGLVEPGVRLLLAGRVDRIRSRMFTYDAQAFVERQLVFETQVMGVIV